MSHQAKQKTVMCFGDSNTWGFPPDCGAPPFYTAFLDAVKTGADFSELTTLGFQLTDSALTADRATFEGLCGLEVNPGRWWPAKT